MLTVPANWLVSLENVEILALWSNPVLPMQNVQSRMSFQPELWCAPVILDIQEREMSDVTKSVSFLFPCTMTWCICSYMHLSHFAAIPVVVGCSSDDECPLTQACEQRSCINPCNQDNPCSPRAYCTVQQHRPRCACPSGMTGDPYRQCFPSE